MERLESTSSYQQFINMNETGDSCQSSSSNYRQNTQSQIRLSNPQNFSFGLILNPNAFAQIRPSTIQLKQDQEDVKLQGDKNYTQASFPTYSHKKATQSPNKQHIKQNWHARNLKNNNQEQARDFSLTSTLSNSPPPANNLKSDQIREKTPVIIKGVGDSQNVGDNGTSQSNRIKQNPYSKVSSSSQQQRMLTQPQQHPFSPNIINKKQQENVSNNKIYLENPSQQQQTREDALKLINAQKFIQQNNFIPVPPIQNNLIGSSAIQNITTSSLGFARNVPQTSQMMMLQTVPFYPSGENVIDPKIPSRQVKKRSQLAEGPLSIIPMINHVQRRASGLGIFEQTIRRNREEVSQVRRLRRLSERDLLSEEQRLIIDNASEEQGNSDRSFERIVNISEEFINREIKEDDEHQSDFAVNDNGDELKEVNKTTEEESPQSIRYSLGGGNTAVRANHQIQINNPLIRANVGKLKTNTNNSSKANHRQALNRQKQQVQVQKPKKQESRFLKRTIFSQNNIQKRQSSFNTGIANENFQNQSQLQYSHNKSLSEVIYQEIQNDDQNILLYQENEFFRNFSKTPVNNYINQNYPQQVGVLISPPMLLDSNTQFTRSKSDNNNGKQVPVQQNSRIANYPFIVQLSRSSQSSANSQSSSRSHRDFSPDNDLQKNVSFLKKTLNPQSPSNGNIFPSRSRKLVKSQNPQFIRTQQVNFSNTRLTHQESQNLTPSKPSAVQNFGFGFHQMPQFAKQPKSSIINSVLVQINDQATTQDRSDRVKQALRQIIQENQDKLEESKKHLQKSYLYIESANQGTLSPSPQYQRKRFQVANAQNTTGQVQQQNSANSQKFVFNRKYIKLKPLEAYKFNQSNLGSQRENRRRDNSLQPQSANFQQIQTQKVLHSAYAVGEDQNENMNCQDNQLNQHQIQSDQSPTQNNLTQQLQPLTDRQLQQYKSPVKNQGSNKFINNQFKGYSFGGNSSGRKVLSFNRQSIKSPERIRITQQSMIKKE